MDVYINVDVHVGVTRQQQQQQRKEEKPSESEFEIEYMCVLFGNRCLSQIILNRQKKTYTLVK